MQFTAMSIWLFTGLAVLTAGVLAGLQYLRIRPRKLRVITTLFWQQAAEQAHARTLFERFRHPRTYLLLLAVGLLLLLALAQPAFNAAHQPHRVIVLEAGLAMTAGDDRFDNALELVRAQATSLDDDHIAVIAADPQPRLIKHFDEGLVSLENRLAAVRAADTPVIRKDTLQVARSLLAGREKGEIVLVSAQPVTTDDDRVRVLPAGKVFSNAFILSATFIPDAADLTRGVYECRVGFTGRQAGKVTIKVAREEEMLLEQTVDFKPGDVKQFSVPGIAADGSILSAMLAGSDAVTADSRADFQLPDRRRILVVPIDRMELPPGLVTVLDSLPEVTTETAVDANMPVVKVGLADSDAHIRIHPTNAASQLMPIRSSDHPLVDGLVFEDALCRAPATPLKADSGNLPLLTVDGSPVVTVNANASQFAVSQAIFDEDASLVRRTGYMVFWSNVLHRLAGWRSEPLTLSPIQASRSVDTDSASQMLKADMGNFDLVTKAQVSEPAGNGAARLPIWQMLVFAALVLLIVEAVLNIRGRIS